MDCLKTYCLKHLQSQQEVNQLNSKIRAFDNKKRELQDILMEKLKGIFGLKFKHDNKVYRVRRGLRNTYETPTLNMLMTAEIDWSVLEQDTPEAEKQLFESIQDVRKKSKTFIDVKQCGKRKLDSYETTKDTDLTNTAVKLMKFSDNALFLRRKKRSIQHEDSLVQATNQTLEYLNKSDIQCQSFNLTHDNQKKKLFLRREKVFSPARLTGKELFKIIKTTKKAATTKDDFCSKLVHGIHVLMNTKSTTTKERLRYEIQ